MTSSTANVRGGSTVRPYFGTISDTTSYSTANRWTLRQLPTARARRSGRSLGSRGRDNAGTTSSTRLLHVPSHHLSHPRRERSSGKSRVAGYATSMRTQTPSTAQEASSLDKATSPRPPPSPTVVSSLRRQSSSWELLGATRTPMESSSSASETPSSSLLFRRGCRTAQRSRDDACSSLTAA